MNDLQEQLQDVFRDVFDDDEIVLTSDVSAKDIEGWDSLQHINLVIAIERRFKVKFATAEISRLKEPDQNVGTLIRLIGQKLPGPRSERGEG